MTEPGISVIVPVRDGGEAFARCLAGLVALDPAPLEVLVVDDGSRDASADEARSAGARVVTVARRAVLQPRGTWAHATPAGMCCSSSTPTSPSGPTQSLTLHARSRTGVSPP